MMSFKAWVFFEEPLLSYLSLIWTVMLCFLGSHSQITALYGEV
jgi:hypothetical protein